MSAEYDPHAGTKGVSLRDALEKAVAEMKTARINSAATTGMARTLAGSSLSTSRNPWGEVDWAKMLSGEEVQTSSVRKTMIDVTDLEPGNYKLADGKLEPSDTEGSIETVEKQARSIDALWDFIEEHGFFAEAVAYLDARGASPTSR